MFDPDQIVEEYERRINEDRKESKLNDLLDDFNSAYSVKEHTLKEHKDAIYEAKELVDIHLDCYESFIKTRCETLGLVNYELNEDIRASIFLSNHGLYKPANYLLRRWLDTTIYALYFDSEFDKGINTNDIIEKYNKWLNGDKPKKFNFKEILKEVIKETSMNELVINEKTFSDIVYNIFQDLSKYVHYGGIRPEDLKPTIAEYNKEYFENWFRKLTQVNEICYILILSKFPHMVSKDERSYFYFDKRMKKLKELL